MKKIFENVEIGENSFIGDFVSIGVPPRGRKDGELKTVIGKNCVIRSNSVIYAGNTIGDNFETGHNVVIRENNKIGNNVSIGTLSAIEHNVVIEDNARIHSRAFIPEFTELKKDSWIGPGVVITNTLHPKCPKAKQCMKGPVIGENAKIGANSTIMPEIKIGKNSLVGAGSVVTKDVPENSVVAGNPAKIIKKISELKCKKGLVKNPYEHSV